MDMNKPYKVNRGTPCAAPQAFGALKLDSGSFRFPDELWDSE